MKKYLVKERPHPAWDGVQKLYRFPNGFGASVIKAGSGGGWGGSYGADEGLWETAVLKYHGDGFEDFSLTYETSITDDVVGDLTLEDVDKLLHEIMLLE